MTMTNRKTSRLTAASPTRDLMTSLRRSGWGVLEGREWSGLRACLEGLVARLPYKSGQGWATAWEVAKSASLSERWTRRCLSLLEDLGLIIWNRGGVKDGRPQPSWFKIVKARLFELVQEAWETHSEAWRIRKAETAKRLAKLKMLTVRPRKKSGHHLRRSVHTELSADPPPPQGVSKRAGGGGAPAVASPSTIPYERDKMKSNIKHPMYVCQHEGCDCEVENPARYGWENYQDRLWYCPAHSTNGRNFIPDPNSPLSIFDQAKIYWKGAER